MRKIPTLFLRDPEDMCHLLNEVHPECKWVLNGEGVPTRKYDGTCMMLDVDNQWWARYGIKPGKPAPLGFVQVEYDEITGKTVGWGPAERSPFAKFWREALSSMCRPHAVGTYELCGPKVNKNPEGQARHVLIPHGDADVVDGVPRDFAGLRAFLAEFPHEGIVWHHPDGRMAKIKCRDFATS